MKRSKKSIVTTALSLVATAAMIIQISAPSIVKGEPAPDTETLKINISIGTDTGRKPISPYIYGINGIVKSVTQTSARSGGNRLTGYNWENNMSSAGGDWYHYNDDLMVNSMSNDEKAIPAIALTSFAEAAAKKGAYSLVTIPMAGYVANDNLQTVKEDETAPSERFAKIEDRKPGELSLEPDLTDGVVYSDELLNYLVTKLGDSTTETGIKGYCLDNEPALWSETHPRIHPVKATINELIDKSISLASVVKDYDPNADVFGPVLYGYGAFINFQGATDWSDYKQDYRWFIDCYLDKMKNAEQEAGRRLLDVLDVHYYTEAYSSTGHRVSFDGDTGPETVETRVQATRTLWDASYEENSWIQQWNSEFLPVIPNLMASINQYYPGTKLSFSEYGFGAENHISGGVAQADALGIFASNEVYLATLWTLSEKHAYAYSAFNIYTNYDGEGSSFGDTIVESSTDNVDASSVYASVNETDDGKLHVMLINRDLEKASDFNIGIASGSEYKSALVYDFNSEHSKIKLVSGLSGIEGNNLVYHAEPLSVTHLVFSVEDVDYTSLNADIEEANNPKPAEPEQPAQTEPEDTSEAVTEDTEKASGEITADTNENNDESNQDGQDDNQIWLYAGGAVVGICVIAGAILYFIKRKK